MKHNSKTPDTTNDSAAHRTEWMYERKVGLTTHYFPRKVEEVDAVTERFDVERVAEQCEKAGAGWFMLTLHHQPWLMQAPNETLDRITKTNAYTAKRDLAADLYDALSGRNIRMMLYLNLRIDPDGACLPEIKKALGPCPPEDETIDQVAEVYREFAERYGRRVSGWWVDGVWRPEFKAQPEEKREDWFGKLAAALRAGNPDAAVAFNAGVNEAFIRYSVQNDYTAGESNELVDPPTERFVDGAQWHAWPHLGHWWGSGGARFDNEELCDWARRVANGGGVMSFEVGSRGITKSGRNDDNPVLEGPIGAIDPRQVQQIKQVSETVRKR
ncbi:MAG: alpha-L-fucosidase [Candidatus Brocadiia bacterium]